MLQNADQVFPPYFPACTSEALEKKGQTVPLFSGAEQRALCFLDLDRHPICLRTPNMCWFKRQAKEKVSESIRVSESLSRCRFSRNFHLSARTRLLRSRLAFMVWLDFVFFFKKKRKFETISISTDC